MIHYEPKDLPVPDVHRLLLGGVGPRPIALVSTISKKGIPNLTPFSFFNVFGSNPPIIAFSPSRRGRDATLKDTYYNLIDTKECVVQSVTYSMVEQISLASTEYPPDVDEFEKSGLTRIKSEIVKAFRVKESPFQMECRLIEMKSYGEGGGSANIAICEVLKFHVAEDLFINGFIHPNKIDLVARMSANFYTRAFGDSIFEVEKPVGKRGVGYDQLPKFMKDSFVYSANNLGKFANGEVIPDNVQVKEFIDSIEKEEQKNIEVSEEAFHRYMLQKDHKKMLIIVLNLEFSANKTCHLLELTAKTALENNDVSFAWNTALYAGKGIKD